MYAAPGRATRCDVRRVMCQTLSAATPAAARGGGGIGGYVYAAGRTAVAVAVDGSVGRAPRPIPRLRLSSVRCQFRDSFVTSSSSVVRSLFSPS